MAGPGATVPPPFSVSGPTTPLPERVAPPFTKALQDSDQASLEVRRSGPIVALVSGDAIPDESHKLVAQVHYSAELTSMPQGGESEVSKTSRFLMGVASLVIIGCSAAILLGLFLGGGRALYRVARGRPVSSVYEAEFIRLHLEDGDRRGRCHRRVSER